MIPENVTDEMEQAFDAVALHRGDYRGFELDKAIAAAINARPPCVWRKNPLGHWSPDCWPKLGFELDDVMDCYARYCCFCGAPLKGE